MSRRTIVLPLVVVLLILLTGCNLPQMGADASLPAGVEDADCSYEALLEAFEEDGPVNLTPGCVYEIPEVAFYEGGMSPYSAGLPIIRNGSVTIHGNGATVRYVPDPETAPSDLWFRFLVVLHGATLTLENLTLENGYIPPGGETAPTRMGGAIITEGDLIIRNCRFIGNQAFFGGAIGVRNLGSLDVQDSTFEGNSASIGGAISLGDTDALIADSIFRNNQAEFGGAIRTIGFLEIVNTQFENNIASNRGGAIYSESPSTVIRGSSFTNNSAGWAALYGAVQSIENCTFSGNRGGGLISSSELTISHSTIVNNFNGPGLGLSGLPQELRNNIIAFNSPTDCVIEGGSASGEGNLDSDGTCPGTVMTADPVIGPLMNNGGLTLTHALLTGSPAIDAALGACPDSDQTGHARPEGSACDVGAYEWSELGLQDYSLDLGQAFFEDSSTIPGDVLYPEEGYESGESVFTGRAEMAVPCYAGPGPMYAVVSSLQPGALVEIVGISENGDYIVILNPCYPGVQCWAPEGSLDLHDELDPDRVIPDPPRPQEEYEEPPVSETPACIAYCTQEVCEASGGVWQGAAANPPCLCP